MKISVIVNTYNWPQALDLCLRGLAQQTDHNFEVLVADDGSKEDTRNLIESFQVDYPVPLIHVWHEDKGFRRTVILNKAFCRASGEYCIFLDGDCLAFPDFVSQHRKLSKTGCFISGNRVLVGEELTNYLIKNRKIETDKNFTFWFEKLCKREINRILPLIHAKLPDCIRDRNSNKWQTLKGCNFSVWKKDFEEVNGFDENFLGWGFEDSDLAVRLINKGCRNRSGRFATGVLHLHHKQTKQPQAGPNWDRLTERIKDGEYIAEKGLKSYG